MASQRRGHSPRLGVLSTLYYELNATCCTIYIYILDILRWILDLDLLAILLAQ